MPPKLKAIIASKLVTLITNIDEFAVAEFQDYANDIEFSDLNEPSNKERSTALPPVIAENSENLSGVIFPTGLSKEELALYIRPRLVVVKDGTTNKFGHALLAFGDPTSGDDRYVQISSANWYPEHLDSNQMAAYFKENNNKIAFEIKLDVPDEDAMREQLNRLSQKRWLWGACTHNCLSFTKEVLLAGGVSPDIFDEYTTISNRLPDSVLRGIESGIFNAFREIEQQSEFPDEQEILNKLEQAMQDVSFALEEVEVEGNNDLEMMEIGGDIFVSTETSDEYLDNVLINIRRLVESSELSDELKDELLFKIAENALEGVTEQLELAEKDHAESFAHRIKNSDGDNFADLPLSAAYDLPVNKRIAGPQSIEAFNEDPEVFDEVYVSETNYDKQIVLQLGDSDSENLAATYLQEKHKNIYGFSHHLKLIDGQIVDAETGAPLTGEQKSSMLGENSRIIIVGHGITDNNGFTLSGQSAGDLTQLLSDQAVEADDIISRISLVACDCEEEVSATESYGRTLMTELDAFGIRANSLSVPNLTSPGDTRWSEINRIE